MQYNSDFEWLISHLNENSGLKGCSVVAGATIAILTKSDLHHLFDFTDSSNIRAIRIVKK